MSIDTDPNSVASAFTDGSHALVFSTAQGNPAPSVYKTFAELPSTLADSKLGNDYFSFTVTPNSGYELDLTALNFELRRDPTTPGNTIATYTLQSSLDSFATSLSTMALNANSGAWDVDLTSLGAAFQNLLGSIEFRIYLFDNDKTFADKGAYIDNVVLMGDSVATQTGPPGAQLPEATSLAVWSILAIAGGLVVRRRRSVKV